MAILGAVMMFIGLAFFAGGVLTTQRELVAEAESAHQANAYLDTRISDLQSTVQEDDRRVSALENIILSLQVPVVEEPQPSGASGANVLHSPRPKAKRQ